MEGVTVEVRVDPNRIKSERENRGWSQGHLASVAGLSLRTIQRIEKTGSASFESVTALASVLSVDVGDLRANESEPSRGRALRLSLELPIRLALAAVSGVLCALQFRWSLDITRLDRVEVDFVVGGALFAVAVLCPYLKAGRGLLPRALALIAASALSYFCAVMTAANADAWFSAAPVLGFLLASFIGVTFVLVAAKVLIPLRVTTGFWLLGLMASLVGGVAVYAGFEVWGDTRFSNVVGFCVWHLLACMAIYKGRHADDAQDGLLAAFTKVRGRFSIVSCSPIRVTADSVAVANTFRPEKPCNPQARGPRQAVSEAL
jgi:transcriptional regulator with XRE-family HTH domain